MILQNSIPNKRTITSKSDLPSPHSDFDHNIDDSYNPTPPITGNFTNTTSILSTRPENDNITFRLAIVNCQSIFAKKLLFENFVSVYTPDIIAGTESWLRTDIQNSEIFSDVYQVFRQDRSDGFGGVFLACNKMYSWKEINIHKACSCELIASKLELNQRESLIVISAYRPPNTDLTYLESMCNCLNELVDKNPNAVIWFAGDINLPNINWLNCSISGYNYPSSYCNAVLNTFFNAGLTQMVDFPTRNKNTLDIFATNRPTLVNKCIPLPGISDHDIVYIESSLKAVYTPPAKRKQMLWSKANVNQLKDLINDFTSTF